MIQMGSYLRVLDNTGVKFISCIQASKNYKCKYAYIGDVIVASVKSLRRKNKARAKAKKGSVINALIIRVKNKAIKSGINGKLFFRSNCAILLDKKKEKLLGSKILVNIPRVILEQVKEAKSLKLLASSTGILK